MESSAKDPLVRRDDFKEAEMAPTIAKKKPPPEKSEAVQMRTKVVLSFWAVIVFLGLPMWWKTTSIYRARLPVQEMTDWSRGSVSTPILTI